MRWEILLLEPVNDWFLALCKNDPLAADKVEEALDELALCELALCGSQLGRPLADRIHGGKIHNLKELRPRVPGTAEVRLLFVFDAEREAIVLVAGDKAGSLAHLVRRGDPARRGTVRGLPARSRQGGRRMKAVRWAETKRQVRELNADWDAPERVASRERSRTTMCAEQRGHQLAQLRKNTGLTQAQVAAVMGVSQARVSQIEHGKVAEVDAIRGYVEALGGTVDVVARVGDWTVKVA